MWSSFREGGLEEGPAFGVSTCPAVLYRASWTVLSSELMNSSWTSFSFVCSKVLLVSSSLETKKKICFLTYSNLWSASRESQRGPGTLPLLLLIQIHAELLQAGFAILEQLSHLQGREPHLSDLTEMKTVTHSHISRLCVGNKPEWNFYKHTFGSSAGDHLLLLVLFNYKPSIKTNLKIFLLFLNKSSRSISYWWFTAIVFIQSQDKSGCWL